MGVRRNPAAVGHDCSRSGGSWASGDGLYNGRVRCRSTAGSSTRLRSASSLAAASHGRQRRAARVSQHIEPTGLRPSVLPACRAFGLPQTARFGIRCRTSARLPKSTRRHCCAALAGRGCSLFACPQRDGAESGATPRRKMAVRSRPGQAGHEQRRPSPCGHRRRTTAIGAAGCSAGACVRGAKPVSARGVRAAASSRTLSRDLGR